MAEWSARRTRSPAAPGLSSALATCWICSWSSWSSRVQILGHACKLISNWLPPTSWHFKSSNVLFTLFVFNYLSGIPVN